MAGGGVNLNRYWRSAQRGRSRWNMKHQKTTAHSGCTCFQVTTKTLFIQSSVFSTAAAETNHRRHHGEVDILLSSWSFEIRRVWDQNMMSDRGAHPLPEVLAEGHSGSGAGFRFQTRKPSCVYMTNVSTNMVCLFLFGTASACTQRTLTTALWDAGTLCILISLYLLLHYIYHIQQCKNLKM